MASIDEPKEERESTIDDVEGHGFADSPTADSPTADRTDDEGDDVEGHALIDSPAVDSPTAD